MEALATEHILRRAESQDIPRIIELVWANVEEGPYKDKIIFDEHKVSMFVGQLLADEGARVLVSEHEGRINGVFSFTTFPNFFYFAGQLVASMVVWSVEKAFRGRVSMRLLSQGQREARQMGAKYMILTGAKEEFAKLCEHCGYSYLESSHILEL
jgi:hypothetical protein